MGRPISYKDKIMNKNIDQYFHIEDSDDWKDEKSFDYNTNLGDYDLGKYEEE